MLPALRRETYAGDGPPAARRAPPTRLPASIAAIGQQHVDAGVGATRRPVRPVSIASCERRASTGAVRCTAALHRTRNSPGAPCTLPRVLSTVQCQPAPLLLPPPVALALAPLHHPGSGLAAAFLPPFPTKRVSGGVVALSGCPRARRPTIVSARALTLRLQTCLSGRQRLSLGC